MVRLVAFVAVCAIASTAAPQEAFADEAPEAQSEARRLTEQGQAYYRLKDFDKAIESFREAYAKHPVPILLFNLAQSYRAKGDRKNALYFYRWYLRDKPDASDRSAVEAKIERLESEEKASAITPSTDQHASLTQPAGRSSETPSTRVAVDPAQPRATTTNPGATVERTPAWYTDRVGWIVAGGGVVACGVGVAYLGSAGSLEDEARTADEALVPGLLEKANSRRTVGRWTLGLGATVAALGIVKLAIGEKPIRVPALTVSLGSRWIVVAGRF
jgi:tetratricopeptide (TPR) repeat protein